MRLHIMSPHILYNTATWRTLASKHRKGSK